MHRFLKPHKILPIVFLLFMIISCENNTEYRIQGKTMGTTYSVIVIADQFNPEQVKSELDQLLVEINRQMSTWQRDSEISTFNASESTEPFTISDAFYSVVKRSQEISEMSDGAFDITVSPLIDLWGFGSKGRSLKLVSGAQLDSVSEFIGYKKLNLEANFTISKAHSNLSINLSAIAKGFAVDQLAEHISNNYSKSYFVEIGGEIVTAGRNKYGQTWTIGIQKPGDLMQDGEQLQSVIAVSNKAVATSGDYINFFELDGKRYSHTIDPTSRKPIQHQLASVTVIAEDCLTADAYATTLSVLGYERGIEWIKDKNADAYFIQRDGNTFKEYFTDGFKAHLK